jgi:hypothetical protein
MAGNFRAAYLVAFILAPAGCVRPPLPPIGERIDGPYVLAAEIVSNNPGKMVCYQRATGGCDLRIAPPVVRLGWDEDFVSAAVRKAGAPETLDYYYIVRDFDGPDADIMRVVKGPFDEAEFIEERRKHGVPGVAPLAPAS